MAKTKTTREIAAAPKTKKASAKRAKPARPTSRKAGKSQKPVPVTKTAVKRRAGTKQAALIDHLRRNEGATIADLVKATGWQVHSVRGAISGTLKKKLGLAVTSETVEGKGRVYRIV